MEQTSQIDALQSEGMALVKASYDQALLERLKKVLKEGNEGKIVGYEVDGTPITQKQLFAAMQLADQQADRGDFVTLEKLEKEMGSW